MRTGCIRLITALGVRHHGAIPTLTLRAIPRFKTKGHQNAASVDRDAHNAHQVEYFTQELNNMQSSITPEVDARLSLIASSVPNLTPSTRVLDVGAGDGALIPHLFNAGIHDVLAVDACPAMIGALSARLVQMGRTPAVIGNEPGARSWVGDVTAVPAYQGPFDVAYFNAVYGNLHDPREALIRVCFLLRPGSHIVISHPLGRRWHEEYRAANPTVVLHPLPASEVAVRDMIADLPLELVSYNDSDQLYIVVLRVPEGYAHPAAPVMLRGHVTTGFGRGSKQLGIPTANLPPAPLMGQLKSLSTGVYFGWARVGGDSHVHKMVMNLGRRPTFEDDEPELSVEIHIMHKFADDFYGKELRAIVLGFLRPEIKFGGLQDLLSRIHTDIGIARSQLDAPLWAPYQHDEYLLQMK